MAQVYIVRRGDTLFDIARRFYGDGMKFQIIADASGIPNPNLIFPGQVLQIPDLTQPQPAPDPTPPLEPDPPPEPFEFRVLRPADLVNLRCRAIGCRVIRGGAPTGGGTPLTTHTVVRGDNLWNLAQQFYGDPTLFPLIAAANHIPNPNLIFPGTVLIIPALPVPPPPPAPTIHVVVRGDSLWDLAQRFYGNPFRYHEIAAANHIPNPDLIFPGQQLVIPGLPVEQPDPTPGPVPGPRLVAVTEAAHLIVRFGIQNLYEEATADGAIPHPVSQVRAAGDSRLVFELPTGSEVPFTVSGVLHALASLGLRVSALAIPRLEAGSVRPIEASGAPRAPGPDETAIEAPYRLIVSPSSLAGFTHAADAESAPDDADRVELWHSRLGVRKLQNDAFDGVDESADTDDKRTVRAIWTRDLDTQEPIAPEFGSLTRNDRIAIVGQTADPRFVSIGLGTGVTGDHIEPEPLNVDRLYLSSLGAWIDWRVGWPRVDDYPDPVLNAADPLLSVDPLSAYRHLAPMGRDSYVRVEKPVYLFPFGHRGTLVKLTERKISAADGDQMAFLNQRIFIVLREHTRTYTDAEQRQLPFTAVSIDPLVSPDLEDAKPEGECFVPMVSGQPYLWKVAGTDHANQQITMMAPLVAVPKGESAKALDMWNQLLTGALPETQFHPHRPPAAGPTAVNGADIAFAPPKVRGDTSARAQFIHFTGVAQATTSTPQMVRADITIPALAAINKNGGPVAVSYTANYIGAGFLPDPIPGVAPLPNQQAQLFLELTAQGTKLDFAGGSDRGGGFIEPSVGVNALSRTLGAVGDSGASMTAGKYDPAAILGTALPKLFGLFDLIDILETVGTTLSDAPKLIAEQLNLVDSVGSEFGNLGAALDRARVTLDADISTTETAGAKQRLEEVRAQVQQAIDALAANPIQPLLDALGLIPGAIGGANPAAGPAAQILTALNTVEALRANAALPAYLRAQVERPYRAIKPALEAVQDLAKLKNALQSVLDASTIRYEWTPPIKEWNGVFIPGDPRALDIAVEIRTSKDGDPQADVSAQLRNFKLQLLPGSPLMAVKFGRVGFRVATGGKPEVDVQFDGMEFQGPLAFIEKLRRLIPFDGFADPPYVDINTEGATAGFDLALPSVAVGVFTMENIALAADCRIPFLGEAVTVGFGFCSKESPFRLTVMAIGGGGWVAIRLAPKGLVMLEMGLEAGAALSVNLGVASGSVSVMIGVYLRLEGEKGQLTGYFRIRGEVEVLGIASASITLELSLTYQFDTGKLVGRASLRVEVEVLFFSASVEITCERKLAGSKGDPALADIMPPDKGGQAMWDQYYSSFAIGA